MCLPDNISPPERRFHVRNQFVALIIATTTVAAALLLTPPLTAAQGWVTESVCPDDAPAVFHRYAVEAAETFDPLRTPDGRPDMGGIWHLPFGDLGGSYENLEEHPGTPDDRGGGDYRRRSAGQRYVRS